MSEATKPDGGPAFPMAMPTAAGTGVVYGMTLRDYFAAKAMQAIVNRDRDDSAYGSDMMKGRSVLAYEYADAMLAAREAK